MAQKPNSVCFFIRLTHLNKQLKTKLKTSFSRRKGSEFMFASILSSSKFFYFINYSHQKCFHIKCRVKNKIISLSISRHTNLDRFSSASCWKSFFLWSYVKVTKPKVWTFFLKEVLAVTYVLVQAAVLDLDETNLF